MSIERSAGALIVNEHRPKHGKQRGKVRREYLVLRYEAGHWDFPKGHLEGNESPERAAQREIFEETGLRVRRFLPGFKRHMRYHFWSYPQKPGERSRRAFKVVTFFLVEVSSRTVRLSHEHTGYAWLSYREALKLVTYDSARELLQRAESFFRSRSTLRREDISQN